MSPAKVGYLFPTQVRPLITLKYNIFYAVVLYLSPSPYEGENSLMGYFHIQIITVEKTFQSFDTKVYNMTTAERQKLSIITSCPRLAKSTSSCKIFPIHTPDLMA